jgi:CheY-like chemotaxis protein
MSEVKLLVVEDDVASLELMAAVFASLKAEVRPLADSRQAELLVNQETFDGIFLDLEMPGLDGFQLAQKIRASSWNRQTPIIIVTGRDQRDTMRESFASGATFFLQKPIDRRKLGQLFQTVRGSMIQNRRRSIRVPLQTGVNCVINDKTLQGKTWNLSQGGMQVQVECLPPDERIRFSFELPRSRRHIDVWGVVVWAKNDRQRIRFTNVAPQIQDQIKSFVESIDSSMQ